MWSGELDWWWLALLIKRCHSQSHHKTSKLCKTTNLFWSGAGPGVSTPLDAQFLVGRPGGEEQDGNALCWGDLFTGFCQIRENVIGGDSLVDTWCYNSVSVCSRGGWGILGRRQNRETLLGILACSLRTGHNQIPSLGVWSTNPFFLLPEVTFWSTRTLTRRFLLEWVIGLFPQLTPCLRIMCFTTPALTQVIWQY